MASYQRTVELISSRAEAQAPDMGKCILCGGGLESCISNLFDTRFGIDGNYEVRRCLNCGLEQMFPVPTPAALKSLYESHYNFGGERSTLYTNLPGCLLSPFPSPLYLP